MADNSDDITLNCGSLQVNAKYHPGTGTNLIVLFHGAINRDKRETPYFAPMLPRIPHAHQISIFDPTLTQFDDLAAGWYLGWQGAPLWNALSEAIKNFSASCGCTHRTYVGGSSGGFAALLYSSLDQGSTAVAYNPQTDLTNHVYPIAIKNYFSLAWPDIWARQTFDSLPLNVAPFMAQAPDNTVIFLQNSSDLQHLEQQALPFLSALPSSLFSRLVVNIGFEGIHGHGGSIPRETVRQWVEASFAQHASHLPFEAILDAKRAIEATAGVARAPMRRADIPSRPDLRMAKKLADWHLRKALKNNPQQPSV